MDALFYYEMFQPRPSSQGTEVRQYAKSELLRNWESKVQKLVNRSCTGVLIPLQERHLISVVVH